ncbi:MAG: hypothetical protein JKY34_11265 [Kordiimonadaceae bacterium]|nr:hypothetical protein [Kordiimonadaceae bacterium]
MPDLFGFEAAKGKRATSHLAAKQLENAGKLSSRRLSCLVSVAQKRGSGYTVAKKLDLGVTQVRPRLTELEGMGFITDSLKRNKLPWGTSEIVYEVTPAGVAALAIQGVS